MIDPTMAAKLIPELRKASIVVYAAVEEPAAQEISRLLTDAARQLRLALLAVPGVHDVVDRRAVWLEGDGPEHAAFLRSALVAIGQQYLAAMADGSVCTDRSCQRCRIADLVLELEAEGV